MQTKTATALAEAYAHHVAFFTVMAVATLDNAQEMDAMTEAADVAWSDTFLKGAPPVSIIADIAAFSAKVQNITIAAIRATSKHGKPDAAGAGRLILRWAEDSGLGALMLIQRPAH